MMSYHVVSFPSPSFHTSLTHSLLVQDGKTALDIAREWGKIDCVKILEIAGYQVPFDRVMISLHCSTVVQEDVAGESSASSPLREFCTDERYRHLMENMLGKVLCDFE